MILFRPSEASLRHCCLSFDWSLRLGHWSFHLHLPQPRHLFDFIQHGPCRGLGVLAAIGENRMETFRMGLQFGPFRAGSSRNATSISPQRLQSVQPHLELRHLSATSSYSGPLKTLYHWQTLQSSGWPGSARQIRSGSVIIDMTFLRIASGAIGDVDLVEVALRHLAAVEAQQARAGRQLGLRLHQEFSLQERIDVPHDLARQFQVRQLVLAHRHEVRPVKDDVGGLEDRVAQEGVVADIFEASR